MTPKEFVTDLAALSFQNTFNPYRDRCPIHDLKDAPARRRAALLAILKIAAEAPVDAIWIGRDLGYRGGRRTGLALTDDVHAEEHAARWNIPLSRPTKGNLLAEKTAAVIWSTLSQIDSRVFLWNVFPLHPHKLNSPFTNRAHNALERRTGEMFLSMLVNIVNPRRIIAIGNDAASSARIICQGKEVVKVRHPSYGGQTDFLSSIRRLYPATNKLPLPE